MQDEHRLAIQKNFSSLIEQTDLDTMVSALYEKEVFSEQMIEPYKDRSVDARTRKRLLYMDIMRRGPDAFRHLVDALTETGCWHLVRDLDPESSLHMLPRRPPTSATNPRPKSNDSEFLSISTAKKKGITGAAEQRPGAAPTEPLPPPPFESDVPDEIPTFNVIKSTKFMEDDPAKDITLYRTRSRRRGVLVVFSYIEFANNIETYRKGVDVDCRKLKYLFSEFGFEVKSFQNLTKAETLERMKDLPLQGSECVFIVISSHGYERSGSSDTDIRCSDGGLVSSLDIVHRFNNKNCPALRGIPKVFIFQMCRGSKLDYDWAPPATRPAAFTDGAAYTEPARASPPRAPPPLRQDRINSDILIAHSTLPGFVSRREETGSWYIQVLCSVFAARAHDCHVEKLFTLVDRQLHQRFRIQTSVVEKWGFNSELYLHPGLFED